MKSHRVSNLVAIIAFCVAIIGWSLGAMASAGSHSSSDKIYKISNTAGGQYEFQRVAPTPTPTPLSPDKLAIKKAVDEHIDQFAGTCMGAMVTLGRKELFDKGLRDRLNEPVYGIAGSVWIAKNAPKSKGAAHDSSWGDLNANAVIYIKFDPKSANLSFEEKESLFHEMTHHLEFTEGKKEPSKGNTRSERNTEYQDQVIRELRKWRDIEVGVVAGQVKLFDAALAWKEMELALAALDRGGAAFGNKPDPTLIGTTGFDVQFKKIKKEYLSGRCRPEFPILIAFADLLPHATQLNVEDVATNQSDPFQISLGDTLQLRAEIWDVSLSPPVVTIPKAIPSVYVWKANGIEVGRGSSLSFKPDKAIQYTINVELQVEFQGVYEPLLASTNYTVDVSRATPPPNTGGKIELKAPAEALATEFVDASAVIPKELLAGAKSAGWSPESCSDGTNKIESAKLQFRNPRSGKPEPQYISYSLRDAQGGIIREANTTILIKPVLFGGSAPGIWKAGSGPTGVRIERTPAIRMMDDKESGKVIASVEATWMDSFAPKSLAEIEERLKYEKGENTGLSIEPISFAGFQGYLLEMNYIRQGSSYTGYVDLGAPDTSRSGHGMALKGCVAVQFSYSASGGGMIRGQWPNHWWNDVPFLLSHTKAAADEAKAVLRGLTLTQDGRFKETPYAGPKLDGSDLPIVRLEVSPKIAKLKTGDIVNVRAVIDNEMNAGKPVEYVWTGDHAGSGANVTVIAGKPGKQTLSVSVPMVGMASVEFEITEDPAAKAVLAAAEKVTRAKRIVVDGSLDEAIALAEEARAIDPKNAEAASLGSTWKSDRTKISRHIANADSLSNTNKFDQATKEIVAAKAMHPKYPPVLAAEKAVSDRAAKYRANAAETRRQLQQGKDLYEKGEYRPAIAAFDKVIAADRSSADAFAGRCLAKRGVNDAGAAADCEQALKLDPNNAAAYRGRSMIRRVNNDLQGALADADRSVRLAPNEYRSYLTRGLAKEGLGDYQGAFYDYDRSIQLNPGYAPSYRYRGTAQLRLKNYRSALNDLNKYLSLEPNSSVGHNDRGSAKENLGDLQGAVFDYEQALRLDPANETARRNLDRIRNSIAKPTPAPAPTPAVAGEGKPATKGTFNPLDLTPIGGKKGILHELNGIQVDDASYVRLKGTDNERLTYTLNVRGRFRATSIAIVSNLDDSIYVPNGTVIAQFTVVKDTSSESFTIRAGIESSEWNRSDGPRHDTAKQPAIFTLKRPGVITSIQFDYIDPGVQKWYGHAPGFCLKGVTLIAEGPADDVRSSAAPKVIDLLSNMNTGVVTENPTTVSQFDINRNYMITSVVTYHWNSGRGAVPGTITIRSAKGATYGPFRAKGLPAGSVKNAFWEIDPGIILPPGTYTIIDSDPSTWSQNSGSGGRGFTTIRGYLVTGADQPRP